jgi:hypothetical protein
MLISGFLNVVEPLDVLRKTAERLLIDDKALDANEIPSDLGVTKHIQNVPAGASQTQDPTLKGHRNNLVGYSFLS